MRLILSNLYYCNPVWVHWQTNANAILWFVDIAAEMAQPLLSNEDPAAPMQTDSAFSDVAGKIEIKLTWTSTITAFIFI